MPMRNYKLTPERRSQFQQLYLLTRMGKGETFSILLPGELGLLAPLLENMMAHKLVIIPKGSGEYTISECGIQVLETFRQRYRDYLQMYDQYCAVDLGTGDFAFSQMPQLTVEQLQTYLSRPNWEDLRVAVAVYKGLDPLEVVFMSFLNEGRLSHHSGTGWCLDLLGDIVWDDILRICNTALHPEDLGTEDVIQDVITQGSQLMVDLLESAQETTHLEAQRVNPEREVITTTETVTYVEEVTSYSVISGGYYGYYDVGYLGDPFYVSPVWQQPYWYY